MCPVLWVVDLLQMLRFNTQRSTNLLTKVPHLCRETHQEPWVSA